MPSSTLLRPRQRRSRTFAAAELLQHGLVAEGELPGLDDELDARVDTLTGLLLLDLHEMTRSKEA